MNSTVKMTQEGFNKLKAEYNELANVKKPQAILRLKKAREMGDLSENSEYVAAKEDRALVEGRIQELEVLIQNAEIVSPAYGNKHSIDIGNKVTIVCDEEKTTYVIVGEMESDPAVNKISHVSPLGKALMGKKKGDVINVVTPAGTRTCEILEIE